MTAPAVIHDPTDPTTVPATVRRDAFSAAMIALRDSLTEAGYSLDAIGELELVDDELRAIAAAWDASAMVH